MFFESRSFATSKQGQVMLRNSSDQMTIIQSFGGNTLRGISRTTLKSVDIRPYVKPVSMLYRSSAQRSIQTRRGVFQSNPILETLLSYYSSSGIMETIPTEDPGPGNRPSGILALVTAAVGPIW